ncbi:MAG: isoprenyl transferase [Planctomycetes bacterium]|nr:isoprenyl transferase [Planctomycetota bacterium]
MSQSFEEKRQQTADRLGIDPGSIPRHIAVIMDGNGRWAKKQGLSRYRGHEQGGKTVEDIALYCVALGVEYLTLYSFSVENWKRPREEVDFLMYLYSRYLEGIRPILMENNVRLLHVGSKERLPQMVLDSLRETMEITGENDGMVLGLALNYGARTEIVEAAKKIAVEYKSGTLELDDIDKDCLAGHLYTAGWPDPELLIRTSGELRFSNFLLWQISYSEFYVTETLWPDFSRDDLDEAIKTYSGRSRRFGDITSQPAS